MVKPSLIYILVGVVMLKPGWMNRYLPPIGKAVVPDVAVIFGFLGWPDVRLGGAELGRRPEFQRRDLVGIHVGLRDRQ